MACIDKTHVNKAEWLLAKEFNDQTAEEQIRLFGEKQYLYNEWDDIKDLDDTTEITLWNTSSLFDVWLWKTCELPFIRERIVEQYGGSYNKSGTMQNGFDSSFFEKADVNFPFVNIISIMSNDKKIVLEFFHESDPGYISVLDDKDEVLVFGTTFYFKFMHDVTRYLAGYEKFDGEIIFTIFGIDIILINGKMIYADTREEFLMPVHIFVEYIKLPKVKYSFKSKDITKYDKHNVIISDEDGVHMLTTYKKWEDMTDKDIKYCRINIPGYLQGQIK